MKFNLFANICKNDIAKTSKAAVAKLRLESLENRQMLSATTAADLDAIQDVTETAAVQTVEETVAPIDLSAVVETATLLEQYEQIPEDEYVTVETEETTVEIGDYDETTDYVFRVQAVGSGAYESSDFGYVGLGAYQPHIVVDPISDAVNFRHPGVAVANVSASNFEPTEFSVYLNGEPTDVFSVVDGKVIYNGGLTWSEDAIEIEIVASNGEVEASDSILALVNGKLKMTTVKVTPNESTVTLNWTAIANASYYRVQYAAEGDVAFKTLAVSADQTSLELELDPNGSYLFRVKSMGKGVYLNADWSYASLNWNGDYDLRSLELVDVQNVVRNVEYGSVLATLKTANLKGAEYAVLLNGEPTDAIVVADGQLVYASRLPIAEDAYTVEVVATLGKSVLSDSFELTVVGKMDMCRFETSATADSITIAWQEYVGTDSFRVQYKADGDEDYTEVRVTGNSFTLEGLDPGVNYTFRVKALHQADSSFLTSDWSYCDVATVSPSIAIVDSVDSFSFRQRNNVVATFDLVGVDPSTLVVKMNGEATSCFAIRGNSVVYLGGLSWIEEAIELEVSGMSGSVAVSDACETIVNGKLLKADVVVTPSEDSVNVQWKDRNKNINYYRFEYCVGGTEDWTSVVVQPGEGNLDLDIDPNGSYQFRVKAFGSGVYLNSDWSYAALNYEAPNVAEGELEEDGVYLKNVVSSTQNTVYDVVLADISLVGLDPATTEYAVTLNGQKTNAIVVQDGQLVYVGKLAISNDNYQVTLTATCNGVEYSDSFDLNVFGKMNMAKIKTEVVNNTITIAWQEYAEASRYRVQYKPAGSDEYVQIFVTEPTFTIENADVDVQYEVRVKAIAKANTSFRNSDWSYAYAEALLPRVEFDAETTSVYAAAADVVIGRVNVVDFEATDVVVKVDGEVSDKFVIEDGALKYMGGLDAKLGYAIEIVASNADVEASAETTLDAIMKLATPEVDAKVVGTTIVVNWDAIDNADGYILQYTSGNGVSVDLNVDNDDYRVEALDDGLYKLVFVGSASNVEEVEVSELPEEVENVDNLVIEECELWNPTVEEMLEGISYFVISEANKKLFFN